MVGLEIENAAHMGFITRGLLTASGYGKTDFEVIHP
jgi:hypothetical protein